MDEPEARRAFIALVAASQHDLELATALRDRFVAERRAAATSLLNQIAREHPDRDNLDPDIVIDLTYGALYYRLLITGQSHRRTLRRPAPRRHTRPRALNTRQVIAPAQASASSVGAHTSPDGWASLRSTAAPQRTRAR